MNTVFILNGISLHKKRFIRQFNTAVLNSLSAEVWETKSAHDGKRLAKRAIEKGCQQILAVGGDGTLHQVLNGILDEHKGTSPEQLPILGVIPLGSGNDYARTLGISADTKSWVSLVENSRFRPVDVGVVEYLSQSNRSKTYFLNEVDVGMGPEVVRRVTLSSRPLGSAVAYYQAILRTFMTYRPLRVVASAPGWQWDGAVRTFAIAKGKYYGNGLGIAPDALLDDGMFQAFVVGGVSVWDFIRFSHTLKKCRKVSHPRVEYVPIKEVELRSPQSPVVVEADGEVVGELPIRIRLNTSRIRMLIP